MSKIVKSNQSCGNGHLPYHLFILVLSARAQCMTWHVIRVRSKDAQKQLARTSLNSKHQLSNYFALSLTTIESNDVIR